MKLRKSASSSLTEVRTPRWDAFSGEFSEPAFDLIDPASSVVIVVDGSRAARAGLVEQAITAIFQKPAGVLVNAEFGSHRFAWQTVRTSQDHAASLR